MQRNSIARSSHTLVVLLAALLTGLWGCSQEPAPVVERIPAVKTQVVSSSEGSGTRMISAVIQAAESTALAFPKGGTVLNVLVSLGSDVEAGEVLARLDPEQFELGVRSVKAEVTSAQSALLTAKQQYQRVKTLYGKGVVAKVELDSIQAELSKAESTLELTQARLQAAQEDLRRTVIRAPFSGRIASRDVEPYQEVKAGEPVLTLASDDSLEARAEVPADIVRGLFVGMVVQVLVPEKQGAAIAARIAEIGLGATEGGAVPVVVAMNSENAPETGLIVGQTVTLQMPIPAESAHTVVLVPLSALALNEIPELSTDGGTGGRAPIYVFDEKQGVASLRLVEVQGLRENMLAVSSGLSSGEEVIVAGAGLLTDGMPVRRWEPELSPETLHVTPVGVEE